jgi:hypothetical protein
MQSRGNIMNQKDLEMLCRNCEAEAILEIAASEINFLGLISDDFEQADYLIRVISGRLDIYWHLNNDPRFKKLCQTAFKQDIQVLRLIPEDHITEEMAFKAAKLNGDLLSRFRRYDLFSDRVIKLLIQSNHYELVPTGLQKKDDLIESFSLNGILPSRDFWAIVDYTDAIRYIMDNSSIFRQNAKAEVIITCWSMFLDSVSNQEDPYAYALQTLSDEFEHAEHRALAFNFLRLNEPKTAANFLKHDSVRDFIISYHGEGALVEHADTQSRRHLIESGMNI